MVRRDGGTAAWEKFCADLHRTWNEQSDDAVHRFEVSTDVAATCSDLCDDILEQWQRNDLVELADIVMMCFRDQVTRDKFIVRIGYANWLADPY